eukprot:Selendium_serpulae@DN5743_c0_g1_i12.p1
MGGRRRTRKRGTAAPKKTISVNNSVETHKNVATANPQSPPSTQGTGTSTGTGTGSAASSFSMRLLNPAFAWSKGSGKGSGWASDASTAASSDLSPSNKSNSGEFKRPKMRSITFEVRPSRLDMFDSRSYLRRSELRGFAILGGIMSLTYPWIKVIKNLYQGKPPMSFELAEAMFRDTCLLMFWWFKMGLWAYTSYVNVKLHLAGRLGLRVTRLIQYSTEFVLLAHATFGCLFRDWPIIPSSFILMVATVVFMKMHSFTETNLRYVKERTPLYHYEPSVNLRHFTFFLWAPVCVYEPRYPRSDGFRLWYLVAKSLSLASSMTILYVLITDHLLPTTFMCAHLPVLEFFARLMMPYMFAGLLTFYILFECVCNMFAEITNFGDREFYQDWWNSTGFEGFNRLWNRPVHEFLLRHIYFESLLSLQVNKWKATLLTFLFSAIVHEAILAVCFRMVRAYIMGFMAIQIPMIAFGNAFKGSIRGNIIFWLSMFYGLPCVGLCYGREWAKFEHQRLGIDPLSFLAPDAAAILPDGEVYPTIRLF